MKARDIEQKYPPEKAKKLMAALRSRNLFYWDEDFLEMKRWDIVQNLVFCDVSRKKKDTQIEREREREIHQCMNIRMYILIY